MCDGVRMKRFTIIELLVVIAVLGVLASLLLPSLTKARSKARIAVELSNRKQLGFASFAYAKENNGKFPLRGSAQYLHALKYNGQNNLNVILVEKYIGVGSEIREEIMFCDSTLLTVRNPYLHNEYTNNHTQNAANYCTLNYYNIPNGGTLLEPGFDNETMMQASGDNPLWGCMLLNTGSVWMGHDTPRILTTAEGSSTVFVDGGAEWVRANSFKDVWLAPGGFRYYMGMR